MEINKPDQGIFKGIGALQQNNHINKKYFPKTRNIHQFQYTHSHKNDYLTAFEHFFYAKQQQPQVKVIKNNNNQSTIILGQNRQKAQSLNRTDYRKFDFFPPPAPIKPKEEGIQLGNTASEKEHEMHYKTTAQYFGEMKKDKMKQNQLAYRDSRPMRFNPITGEGREGISFGFEDFSMNKRKEYKANNFTRIPQTGQRFDIITGRKLTYQ